MYIYIYMYYMHTLQRSDVSDSQSECSAVVPSRMRADDV